MKKLNYILLGAAALVMASCSQDDMLKAPQGEGNYNVTVKLPSDGVTTRALGNGLTADNLYMAVYDADNGNTFIYKDLGITFGGQLETTVSLNLATGKQYTIAFFALSPQAANDQVYNFDPEGGILEVKYENMTSAGNLADAYDCFYRCYPTDVISGNMQTETIELYRPVAQVNWGTNDLIQPAIADNFGASGEYIQASLNTTAYNKMNLMTSDVVADATVPVNLQNWTAPTEEAFPVDGYDYVAMEYMLAPKEESAVYDLTLNVSNAGKPGATALANDIVVSSAPVQANFRTNIYGNLLSDNVSFEVVKDPDWGTPDYNFDIIDGKQYKVIASDDQTSIRLGGNMILHGDYAYTGTSDGSYLMINQNTDLNLNGYELSSTKPGQYDATMTIGGTSVSNVTLTNGTIAPLTNNTTAEPAIIFVRPVNDVQVTLNDITAIGMHPVWMNAANANSTGSRITINGGTYNSQSTTSPAVYVSAYNGVNTAGQVVINGGTFGQAGITNAFLLNVLDRLREGKDPREFIIVYGGTFINFDPANCASEGIPTNFVADGYQTVASQVGGDTYYTVVPAGYTPVTSQEELQAAVATPNATIYLQGDTYTFPTKVATGVTFIGSDNTTINVGTSKAANYDGVTFKNIHFVGTDNYSGLQHSKNLTYEDCVLDGIFFNYSEGLTYNNCTFNQTKVDYNVWTYTANDVVFNNCTFNCVGKSVLIYNELSASSATLTITFNGCTFKSSQPANDGKAAIEIGAGSPYIVNINNCKATGFDEGSLSGNTLWNHKTTVNPCTVNVNGQQVYTN